MHFSNFCNKLLIFLVYVIGWGCPIYGTQWYQVSTPNFDILLQKKLLPIIQPLANKLEILYNPWRKSMLNTKTKKLSLIFNEGAYNQGMFALGPRRIDLYCFPPADPFFLGNNDWLDMLLVHEGRHRMQSDLCCFTAKKNIGSLIFNLGLVDLTIPPWFDEGDAVAVETALSKSGRGRILKFGLCYRTNLLERGLFGYYKQMGMGSFKHQVPDHYPPGYFLVTYLRRKYGSQVIGEIYKNTSSRFFLFPFSFLYAVKKVTNRTLLQIYQDAHQELLTLWKKQLDGLPITPVEVVHTRRTSKYNNTEFINYLYPQFYDSEHIILYMYGIGTLPQLVLVKVSQLNKNNSNQVFSQKQSKPFKNKIKKLCFLRQPFSNYFSVAGDKIIWVENRKDSLKGDKCKHTTIQLYNILTRKCRQLTTLGRYNMAVLSPDATQIVAVESSAVYQHQLVILDANNGRVICRILNPNNYYYMNPSWTEDGQEIIALRTAEQKSTVVRINIKTSSEESIYPVSEEHISHPKIYGKYLFYNSAYNGIDNIYAMDLQTKQRFQVTSRKYGAYHPVISKDGTWIFFNDFTKDGMDVVKIPFHPASWIPIEQVENRDIQYCQPLVEQEENNHPMFQPNLLNHYYPVKKYQPWKHWLNLSKLGLNSASIVVPRGLHGFIAFKDVLREMSMALNYDFEEKKRKTFRNYTTEDIISSNGLLLSIKYKGWYPIIKIKGSIAHCEDIKYKFLGCIEFPYYRQSNLFTQSILLSTGLKWCHKTEFISTFKRSEPAKTFSPFLSFLFQNVSDIRSQRDVLDSVYSQELKVSYSATPFLCLGNVGSQKFKIDTTFTLPGLRKHHVMSIMPSFHTIFKEIYQDDNKEKLLDKDEKYIPKVIFTYRYPLLYPDWGERVLFYLQRIHVKLQYKWDSYFAFKSHTQERSTHLLQGICCFRFFLLTFKSPITVFGGPEIRWDKHFVEHKNKIINKSNRFIFGFRLEKK